MSVLEVFIAIAASLGISMVGFPTSQASQEGGIYPARSYRMISTTTKYSRKGLAQVTAMRIRWVTATGQWKEAEITIGRGGRTQVSDFYTGEGGVYKVDKETNSLQFISSTIPRGDEFRSTQFLRQRPGLIREDSLLGFATFVYRVESDLNSPDKFIEAHYAPEIGGIPVKSVLHFPDGRRDVQETIAIDFIEVTEETLARPDLPVRSDLLERKIADLITKDVMRGLPRRRRP